MNYNEIQVGRKVLTANGTTATVRKKEDRLQLVNLCFDLTDGLKQDTDGWWRPSCIDSYVEEHST